MMTMTTLYVREGSEFREADDHDILTRAHTLIAQRYRSGAPALADPARTAEFLRIHTGARDHEVFGLLHLNNRHRLEHEQPAQYDRLLRERKGNGKP
jgi:DNA repair protein RadC